MIDIYPVNDYGPLMPGLVMAAVAIVHVFLAQFAVGGGILLSYFQWLAMTGRSESRTQCDTCYFPTGFVSKKWQDFASTAASRMIHIDHRLKEEESND